jgi:hypothetical protein
MPKVGISAALAVLLALSSMSPLMSRASAADQPKPPMKLKVGDMAPDFKLSYFDGTDLKDVTLSQYRGKKQVMLGFFIFAFTGG